MADKQTDPNSNEPNAEAVIAALKRELAGYVADGRTDRADAVRAQLRRRGEGDDPVERAVAEAPEKATRTRSGSARKSSRKDG